MKHGNKSLWATFEHRPAKDDKERAFNKAEGSRVTAAINTLKGHPGNKLTKQQIANNISALLNYSQVSDEYDKAALADFGYVATWHRFREERKWGAPAVLGAPRGVLAKVNKRTNDENIFCYVVTRHLATTFSAFDGLNSLSKIDKNEIIDLVINEIMTTNNNGATLAWNFDEDKKKLLKQNIIDALAEWEKRLNSLENDISSFDLSAESPISLSLEVERRDVSEHTSAAHNTPNFPLSYPSSESAKRHVSLEKSVVSPPIDQKVSTPQHHSFRTNLQQKQEQKSSVKSETVASSNLSSRISNLNKSWSVGTGQMQQRTAVASVSTGVPVLVQKGIDDAKKKQKQAKLAAINREKNKLPFSEDSKPTTKPMPGNKGKR